jgi:hypothetical protein
MTSESGPIRILSEESWAWARAHPTLFFSDGIPSLHELHEQLLRGARALSNGPVSAFSVDDWRVVGAGEDWFALGSGRRAGRSLFHHLHAFPEQGENCSRPEFPVGAFARDVITRGPEGTRVVKGAGDGGESEIWATAAREHWQRVVAFRGLHDGS